jgi:hypothetical protein
MKLVQKYRYGHPIMRSFVYIVQITHKNQWGQGREENTTPNLSMVFHCCDQLDMSVNPRVSNTFALYS